MHLDRVGVVGCGLMGAGIAEVAARAGCDVVVVELDEGSAKAGRQRIERSLARAGERGKLSSNEVDSALDRLAVVTEMGALSERDVVIEAVPEDADLKRHVFEVLDDVAANDDVVLASNTSSIPIVQVAMATRRPQRVIGLHFFNPAPVMQLVEIVPSLLTDDSTLRVVEDFATQRLGKHVVRAPDQAGFVVNALLFPYIVSVIRMLESGIASAADIDEGIVRGVGHPMGPLALADLVGLDTTAAIAESMYQEYRDPSYAPPPLLNRMVAAGLLGRKSGRGFFRYEA
jgi:3-hydroxybutyryl-CoA dehydrogenase